MIVRFATLCDLCGRRSEEYTSWPHCRDCYQDICPTCGWAAGTRIEADLDTPDTVICRACYKDYDMKDYDISFYGRMRQRPTGPRFFVRETFTAAGLHDARRQLHEAFVDIDMVTVLRTRDTGSEDWTYPGDKL